jgi:hypothetical protein
MYHPPIAGTRERWVESNAPEWVGASHRTCCCTTRSTPTHTFRGTFPQPFYVTYRRRAESFWYSRLKYEAFATPLVIPLIVEYASGADVVKFCDCVGGERDFRCGDVFAEVCDR